MRSPEVQENWVRRFGTLPEEMPSASSDRFLPSIPGGWTGWFLAGVSLSFIAGTVLVPVMRFLVTLQTASWEGAPAWRWGLLAGLTALGLMAVLRCIGQKMRAWQRSRSTLTDMAGTAVAALSLLALVNGIFSLPRAQWLFWESLKVREARHNYVRSVAYWNTGDGARVFAKKHDDQRGRLVCLGSSQINLVVNMDVLQRNCPTLRVVKQVLPGFSVWQYALALTQLDLRPGDRILCWISEFDMFREDRLPLNRMRHMASREGWRLVFSSLTWKERWTNRRELAELAVAAAVPVRRERDSITALSEDFWWRAKESEPGLARSALELIQLQNAARQIRRGELLEANFRAFSTFVQAARTLGVSLFVVEGTGHPELLRAVSAEFRPETRARLEAMSREEGFSYLPSTTLGDWEAEDFMDLYHVNPTAAMRVSERLGILLSSAMNNPTEPGAQEGSVVAERGNER